MKIAKAPKELNVAGKKFWKKVLSEYDLEETHDLERLAIACKCLDEIDVAEQRVKIDGMFMVNRYGNTTEHVGVKMIRDSRTLFVKIIRELALDIVTTGDSRPPRQY